MLITALIVIVILFVCLCVFKTRADNRPISVLGDKKIKEHEDLLKIICPSCPRPTKLKRTARVGDLYKLRSLIEEYRRAREYNQTRIWDFMQRTQPILNPDPSFRGSWTRRYMIRPGLAELKAELEDKEKALREEVKRAVDSVFEKIPYYEGSLP